MIVQNEYETQVRNYISHKRAEGLKDSTLRDLTGRLSMIGRQCNFTTMKDINSEALEALFRKNGAINEDTGLAERAAATRLLHWKYGHQFFEWLVIRGLIEVNPVTNAPRPKNLRRDIRKKRRALSEIELGNLFAVAKLRPLAEYGRSRLIGSRNKERWEANPITVLNIEYFADEARKMLNEKIAKRKEIDGRKWYLAYKSLVYTGLRWSELKSITVAQMQLGPHPTIDLDAPDAKNSNSAQIQLNLELATELQQWIIDQGLGDKDRLFSLPSKGMKRCLNDLKAAGIERLDRRGRSIDIHSLRHLFATILARNGVHPHVCKTAMRHSDIKQTMNYYTHAEVGDVAAAMKTLPSFAPQPALLQASEASSVKPAGQNDSLAATSGLSPEEALMLAMYRKGDADKRKRPS